MKMAIRAAIVSRRRKDFGGAGGGVGGGPGGKGGRRGWTGDQRRRSLSVCLSVVCPLREELVRAALASESMLTVKQVENWFRKKR